MTTEDSVAEIIAEEIHSTPDKVKSATSLQELNIESLEMIEIVMSIEEKLSILISDRDLQSLTSLQELVKLVDIALAAKEAGTDAEPAVVPDQSHEAS